MRKFSIILLTIFSFLLLIGCNDKLIINGVEIEIYSIHTELQEEFLSGDYNLISTIATGSEELSYPHPITLDLKKLSKFKEDNKYKVFLSDNYEFKDYVKYTTEEDKLEIYNLKLNVVYYWKVVGAEESKVYGFRIDSVVPIRNLYIDGITNARDIGGYPIYSSCFVKQGMIYRTSKLNDDESTTVLITEKGINTLKGDLGVVVELDLRDAEVNENGGITESPLGSEVRYISVSMKSGGNYLTLNKDVLKDVFRILGDEKNYPMVMHCSIGTDRTGLICFLINGLLGVDEQYLYQDYLFSNFGYIYGVRTPSAIKDYLKQVKYYGDDNATRIYNFLLAQGVLKEDLDNVIKIMQTERIQPE